MSGEHVFKLRLPNGMEVEIKGDKDFVAAGYSDIKSAAVQIFNREAARTSQQAAMDKILGETVSHSQSGPALPAPAAGTIVVESGKSNTSARKKKVTKVSSVQGEAKQTRKAKLLAIKKATTFDDFERYNASVQRKDLGHRDRAGLIVRLAQDKFGFENGLGSAEIRWILKERFFQNVGRRSMERALTSTAASFFATSPSDFDDRVKLYRPMKDCIDRVNELLGQPNVLKIVDGGAK